MEEEEELLKGLGMGISAVGGSMSLCWLLAAGTLRLALGHILRSSLNTIMVHRNLGSHVKRNWV